MLAKCRAIWAKSKESTFAQILYEIRWPIAAGIIWAITRVAFPGKNLQFITDFFLAFFFINFFVASFYRISRHDRLETSLTTINDTTNKTENTVAVFVQQFQNAAKINPALQAFVPDVTSLSTSVNAQIRDIRTANSTASSLISEAKPVTFAGTDAGGRPITKELYVGLVTANASNATNPATTIHDVTSNELNKKTAGEKFSSIKKSN